MTSNDSNIITIAIYTHPEFYPPLLNAIDELAGEFKNLQVICRNLHASRWKYPANVQMISSGRSIKIERSEKASTGWKVESFLNFTRTLYRSLKYGKSSWIMCNDPISLFAF